MEGRFTISAIFRMVDRITAPVQRIEQRLNKFASRVSKGLTAVNNVTDKVTTGLKKAALATAAVATAAGAVAYNVFKSGADFEQAIVNVGAVSLMTRDQIADLEKKALELGDSTKFSATEAANAMEVMGRAGFTNAQILDSVGSVLAAAAASGTEMAEVAGHVSNTLKGMGLEAKDAARVADVLALAEARTNSSLSSLGESMKNLAPVARQMGVSFEEAVAATALLQDVGIDASEAGTATATMLTKLASPTKEMAAQMRQLGIDFQDAKGNALGFPEILGQFEKAAGKSGGNMKVIAFFADLVGLRGQKAALNLKEMFATGKFSSLVEELKHAEGTAKKMADLRMDSLNGDIELLSSSVDSLKIALFDTQNGPLRDIVKSMTAWVDANKELIKTGFVEAVEKWTPIVVAFAGGIRDGFNDAIKPVMAVAGWFGRLFGDESAGPRVAAAIWGERIAKLAVAFAAWAVVTKVATAVAFTFTLVTNAATIATTSWTVATTIARNAMILLTLARQFGLPYLWALITGTQLETTATAGNTVAKGTNAVATRIASAASAFFAVTTNSSTASLIASKTALTGAQAGMLAFAAAAGAAIGAFMILNDQLQKFSKENDGLGFLDMAGEWLTSDKSASQIVDDHMNKKAKARAATRADQVAKAIPGQGDVMLPTQAWQQPDMANLDKTFSALNLGTAGAMPDLSALENLQVSGPAQITLPEGFDARQLNDEMTITIKDETAGGKAEVTKKPKSAKKKLKLQQTGT